MFLIRNFLFSKKSFVFFVVFALLAATSCKLINSDVETSENPKSSVEFAFSKTIFKSLTDSSGQSVDACQFKIVISGENLDSPVEKLWEVSSENLETTVYFIDDLPVACELSIDACILIDGEVCYKAETVQKTLAEGDNEINFVLKKVANSSEDDDVDDEDEDNMPELFTMTAEACDEGIKVTVSYTELAGGEFIIAGNDIYESNTGLNVSYPSSLNETGSCTFVFPFTESGKEYTFGIRGNYNGNAYDGYFDKKIVSCSATVTTEEGAWFEKNRDYFNNFDVDCKYNFSTKSVEATRNFPTVEGMSESESLAKIKEIKESVLSTPSSITKIEKRFSCFVYGYVDWNPGATFQGLGAQELTLDDISTTETSYLSSLYTFEPDSFIDNGYDGKYAGCYGYFISTSDFTWRTWDRWSDQEYFYVDAENIVTATTSEGTRVLHAIYIPTYKKYIVIGEEHKTVASGTGLENLVGIDIVADYIGSKLDISLDDLVARGINLDDFVSGDTSLEDLVDGDTSIDDLIDGDTSIEDLVDGDTSIDDLIDGATSLEDLLPSDISWTVAGLVEGDDYVAVLYKPVDDTYTFE